MVHFIFQPAEEGRGGAKRMVEEGLFERFPCDMVFGLHNMPGMAPGEMAVVEGPQLASSDQAARSSRLKKLSLRTRKTNTYQFEKWCQETDLERLVGPAVRQSQACVN